MLTLLLLLPLSAAFALVRARGVLALWLHAASAAGTLGVALAVAREVAAGHTPVGLDGLVRADALSAWMLVLVALVAALAAWEAPRYVTAADGGRFYPLLHLFVFTMLLAVTADDPALMWVAVEATTLASVFLVNFERTPAALEASYKYLLICSVGIALAFIGTILLYFAVAEAHGPAGVIRWSRVAAVSGSLPAPVVILAFVFVAIGYGTKAGFAPMHTWLPDAHSEAPAPISALMSGVLLSVGVYAIARFKPIADAAVGEAFAARVLVAFGLASLALSAMFLATTTSYKRMLAYSSIEHLGIVALGLGFGGTWATAGALLHVANHALAKSALFLLAGRIRHVYGTADIDGVRGLWRGVPQTSRWFMLGLVALLGLPPFGLFVSEVMIFRGGVERGWMAAVVAALVLLVIASAGLLRSAHRMLYGPATTTALREPEGWPAAVPVALAVVLLLVSGLAWPPGLATAVDRVAAVIAR